MRKIAALALCTLFAVGLASAPVVAMDYAISEHCKSVDTVGNQLNCHNAWAEGRTYFGLTCLGVSLIPGVGPVLGGVCGAYVLA